MKHCQRHGPEKDPYCVDCLKDERERDALCPSDATTCSPSSLTRETDQLEECDQYKVDEDYAEYNAYRRMVEHAKTLERERDEWRKKAVDLHKMKHRVSQLLEHRGHVAAEAVMDKMAEEFEDGPWSYDLYADGLEPVALLNNPAHSQGEWVSIEDYREVESERDEAREIAKGSCAMLAKNGFETNYPPMPWDSDSPENETSPSVGAKEKPKTP